MNETPPSITADAMHFQPRALVQLPPAQADAYVATWRAMTQPERDLVRLEVMYNVDQTARVNATLASRAMQFQSDSTSALIAFSLAALVLGMLVGWSWRGSSAKRATKVSPATVLA